jgi:hypothetical protein
LPVNAVFLAATNKRAGAGALQAVLYATTVLVIMPNLPVFSSNPVPVQSNPMLLHVCGWAVSAGIPSPAAEHVKKTNRLESAAC